MSLRPEIRPRAHAEVIVLQESPFHLNVILTLKQQFYFERRWFSRQPLSSS